MDTTLPPDSPKTSSSGQIDKLRNSMARARALSAMVQETPEPRRKVLENLLRAQEAVVMARQKLADKACAQLTPRVVS